MTTPIYGKDFGKKIKLGEVLEELKQRKDVDDFCDKLDELFFEGAYPEFTSGTRISESFKRDIRGLLYAALHKSL